MQDTYLKPTHVEHQRYELCGLDLMFGFHYSDTVLFLNAEFDIARLEPALLKMLEQIPVLAGKLVKDGDVITLDTDGPGLLLTYEMAEQPAPAFGDAVFPISGYGFFNAISTLVSGPISEWPLMGIKVTTFSDGVRCIGIRHNHALIDGTSFFAFLTAWNAYLDAGSVEPLQFSRAALLAMAQSGANLPSRQSGVRATDDRLVVSAPTFFQNQFATVEMPASEYARLVALVREQHKDIISINDLMQALVFKAFGLSSSQRDTEPAIANLSFDIRRVKGSSLPLQYFGNAVLFRRLEMSFGELRGIALLELAQRFKQTSEPDLASIAQDIGFYQTQYEAGNYSAQGIYSTFAPVLGNGGLYINNMLSLLKAPLFNFGGAQIGEGSVLPREFGVRLAMLIPSRKKDILIRLALEKPQIDLFAEHWSGLIKQTLQQGL